MNLKIGNLVKVNKGCIKKGCLEETCEFINKVGKVCSIGTNGEIGVNNFVDTAFWCDGFTEDCLILVEKSKISKNFKSNPIGKRVKRFAGFKEREKIIIKDPNATYSEQNMVAANLGATNWKKGMFPKINKIGVIKKILLLKGLSYFLIDINKEEYIMDRNGFISYKTIKKEQHNKIKIDIKIHKILCQRLKNKKYNEISSKSFPVCYLLGINKNNTVDTIKRLSINYNAENCENMPSISSSSMNKAMIKIIKKKRKPIGLVRVGNFPLENKIDGYRGQSLSEIGYMNKKAIILSYSRGGIKIESYNPKTRKITNYTYVLTHK